MINIPRRRLLTGMALGAALPAKAAPLPVQAPLTIWFTVEGAKGMRRLAEAFTADTGVPVQVETPDNGPAKFQQAAAAGKGPDLYIYSHDRIGEWIGAGLLHAVQPSAALRQDIDPLAWDGFTWRGRVWGYPYAVEAVNLVYNRKLVPQPPRSFEELMALDQQLQAQGRRAILWDYSNNYFTWPLLAAHGGYAFKRRADGSYDPRDTGVDTAGALPGARVLERLLREGRMPPGAGYAEMEAAMAQERVAMMINGPWSWVNLRRAGIDFGVARVPAVAGRPSRPFVGVKGVMINRATKQRELAVEFIEQYLLSPRGLALVDHAEPIGAPASRRFFAELQARPGTGELVQGIMDSARDGVPTPCIPEMGRFWSAMKSSLTLLAEGRLEASQALAAAGRRIREAS